MSQDTGIRVWPEGIALERRFVSIVLVGVAFEDSNRYLAAPHFVRRFAFESWVKFS